MADAIKYPIVPDTTITSSFQPPGRTITYWSALYKPDLTGHPDLAPKDGRPQLPYLLLFSLQQSMPESIQLGDFWLNPEGSSTVGYVFTDAIPSDLNAFYKDLCTKVTVKPKTGKWTGLGIAVEYNWDQYPNGTQQQPLLMWARGVASEELDVTWLSVSKEGDKYQPSAGCYTALELKSGFIPGLPLEFDGPVHDLGTPMRWQGPKTAGVVQCLDALLGFFVGPGDHVSFSCPVTGENMGVCTFDAVFADRSKIPVELRCVIDAGVVRYPLFGPAPATKIDGICAEITWNFLRMEESLVKLAQKDPPGKGLSINPDLDTWADPSGNPIVLQPNLAGEESPGFVPARSFSPPGSSTATYDYLVPTGDWLASNQQMCGLLEVEYLIEEGQSWNDILQAIRFVPGQKAYLKTEKGTNPATRYALDSTAADTAWAQLVYASTPKSVAYHGLPAGDPYFALDKNGDTFYEIDKMTGDLPAPPPSTSQPFPLFPYKGVYQQKDDNPSTSPEIFEALEAQVWMPQRANALVELQSDIDLTAWYTPSGATGKSFARSAHGFLFEKDTSGSETLYLAKSPEADPQPDQTFIKLIGSKGLNKPLKNALLSTAPFLVVTSDGLTNIALGSTEFETDLQLGEFVFDVDLRKTLTTKTGATVQPLLLFKLTTSASLTDLVELDDAWMAPDTFVGQGKQAEVQTTIGGILSTAAKNTTALYENFNTTVQDPNWVGMLVLNCPLNDQQLPPDIGMLLGGIQGDLFAHHFGVSLNFLDVTDQGISIQKSSLFALIDYENPLSSSYGDSPNNYDFTVTRFISQFENSALVTFEAQIAVSVPTLFGDLVPQGVSTPPHAYKLEPPDPRTPANNVIAVKGKYQKHKGPGREPGHIVFEADKTWTFTPHAKPSVIASLVANRVTMFPVGSTKDNGDTIVTAHFALSGEVTFDNTGTGQDPSDLFSFTGEKSVFFDGYNLAIPTKIPATGTPSLETITEDVSQLRLSTQGGMATPQPKSLLATMPLEIGALRRVPPGQSSLPVLLDSLDLACPLLGDAPPSYALELTANLGTLGALQQTRHMLNTTVLLGWSPDTNVGGTGETGHQVGVCLVPPSGMTTSSFKVEGVIHADFDQANLRRAGQAQNEVFFIELADVNLRALGLPVLPPKPELAGLAGGPGIPDKPSLGIFGNPGQVGNPQLSWYIGYLVADDAKIKPPKGHRDMGLDIALLIDLGLRAGLKVNTDPLSIDVIGGAIAAIRANENALDRCLNELISKIGDGDEKEIVPDPSAGVLFWLDIDLAAITFQAIFQDPDFYGAKLAIPEDQPEGVSPLSKIRKKLEGMKVTFLYRKINDHLGEYAGLFVPPTALQEIKMGKEVTLHLPSIGLEVFTNKDFKAQFGWPFRSSTPKLGLTVPVEGIPVTGLVGAYFGILHGQDAPDKYGDYFNTIYVFGLGLSAGVGVEKEKGPLKMSAEISAFVTGEGFLASTNPKRLMDPKNKSGNDIDYYWASLSVGISATIKGELDLKLLSAELSIAAAIALSVAMETLHDFVLEPTATISVKLSVKIVFVKIHFTFSASVSLGTLVLGDSGHPAQLSGPSPKVLEGSLFSPSAPTELPMATSPAAQATGGGGGLTTLPPLAPVDLPLFAMLQPTAVAQSTTSWQACNVVSLVTNTLDPDPKKPFPSYKNFSLVTTDASYCPLINLVNGLVNWLMDKHGGPNPATDLDRLNAVVQYLTPDPQTPDTTLYTSSDIESSLADFTLKLQSLPESSDDLHAVPYPMPGGFSLKLPKSSSFTPFSDLTADLFDQFFLILARHVIDRLIDLIQLADKARTTKQYLGSLPAPNETDLGTFDFDSEAKSYYVNAAGFMSRFFLHGARNHDQGLFVATGQQVALAAGEYDLKGANQQAAAQFSDPVFTDLSTYLPSGFTPWTKMEFPTLAKTQTIPLSFNLTDQRTTSDGQHLRMLPLALRDVLAADTSLTLSVYAPAGPQKPPFTVPKSLEFQQELLVSLNIRAVGDSSLHVFELGAIDKESQALLESLLDLGTSLETTVSGLELLKAGSSAEKEYVALSGLSLLARANLVTTEVAAVKDLDTANTATLSTKTDFLRMVWESSTVNAPGYFLYLPGEDSKLTQIVLEVSLVDTAALKLANALSLDASEAGKHLLATPQKAGNPVETTHTTWPGGKVGLQIDWSSAAKSYPIGTGTDPKAAISAYLQGLYHILQYQVTSISGDQANVHQDQLGVWSKPLSHHTPDGTQDWRYQKLVEIAPRVIGSNRYDAIGRTFNLKFRLLDVYGNALPDSMTKSWPPPHKPIEILYTDPLVSIDHWPGVSTSYLVSGSVPSPVLDLYFRYTPAESLVGSSLADRRGLINQMSLINDQIADENLSIQVANSLIGSGTTTLTAAQKEQVVAFLAQILKFLEQTNIAPSPQPIEPDPIVISLESSDVGSLQTDLFELKTTVTLDRPTALVDPEVTVPAVGSVVAMVPPHTDLPDAKSGDIPPRLLRAFADSLEQAYWDATSKSGLKVAQGPRISGDDHGGTRSLWAMRWDAGTGTNTGVRVAFASSAPNYFAPQPLSTRLITAQAWINDSATATPQIRNFANIDMDGWARSFLEEFHLLLSTDSAVRVAQVSPTDYDGLMTAKAKIAAAIAGQLTSVFEVSGAIPAADSPTEDMFEESLFTTLTNDYGTCTVVATPATVNVKSGFNEHQSPLPPQFFGKVTVDPSSKDYQKGKAYTIGSARLLTPAKATPPAGTQETTAFLVAAKNPGADRDLDLILGYAIGAFDHQFEATEERFGYIPSTWQAFVLPAGSKNGAPPMSVGMNEHHIPVPLRSFPHPPRFFGQQQASPRNVAPPTQPLPLSLDDFKDWLVGSLDWTYELEVGAPEADQDTLHLIIRFDESPHDASTWLPDKYKPLNLTALEPTYPSTPQDLFRALARFVSEYPGYRADLGQVGDPVISTNTKAVAGILGLAEGIASTWPSWTSPAHAEGAEPPSPSLPELHYAVATPNDDREHLEMTWTNSDAVPCKINGQPLDGKTGSIKIPKPENGLLQLDWSGLTILNHQTAHAYAYIERNSNLGVQVNPAFVYDTPIAKFGTPMFPLNVASERVSVKDSVENVIDALFNTFTTSAWQSELKFRLQVDTRTTLATNTSGDKLTAVAPFKYTEIVESTGDLPNFEKQLVTAIQGAPNLEAVQLSLTLFANVSDQEVPIVRYQDIEIVL